MAVKIKARLIELLRTRSGGYRLTIETNADISELFDSLADHDVSIDIRKYRKARSLDANAYAWVLIGKLSDALRIDRDVIYKEAIRHIAGVSEVVCMRSDTVDRFRSIWENSGTGYQMETFPSKFAGYTNAIIYYGSSSYDTKQMSQLIEYLVTECKEQGIETLSPEELHRLTGG